MPWENNNITLFKKSKLQSSLYSMIVISGKYIYFFICIERKIRRIPPGYGKSDFFGGFLNFQIVYDKHYFSNHKTHKYIT